MKARDREVRAHEQAHKAVGGRYAGAVSYDYQKGPDGQQYAVSGEVPIDASPVNGDPEATISKMEVVIAAALAPVEPSPQDRAVAAAARAQLIQAQADLRAQDRAERDARLEALAGSSRSSVEFLNEASEDWLTQDWRARNPYAAALANPVAAEPAFVALIA